MVLNTRSCQAPAAALTVIAVPQAAAKANNKSESRRFVDAPAAEKATDDAPRNDTGIKEGVVMADRLADDQLGRVRSIEAVILHGGVAFLPLWLVQHHQSGAVPGPQRKGLKAGAPGVFRVAVSAPEAEERKKKKKWSPKRKRG